MSGQCCKANLNRNDANIVDENANIEAFQEVFDFVVNRLVVRKIDFQNFRLHGMFGNYKLFLVTNAKGKSKKASAHITPISPKVGPGNIVAFGIRLITLETRL